MICTAQQACSTESAEDLRDLQDLKPQPGLLLGHAARQRHLARGVELVVGVLILLPRAHAESSKKRRDKTESAIAALLSRAVSQAIARGLADFRELGPADPSGCTAA
jgi:hypothetical protein